MLIALPREVRKQRSIQKQGFIRKVRLVQKGKEPSEGRTEGRAHGGKDGRNERTRKEGTLGKKELAKEIIKQRTT